MILCCRWPFSAALGSHEDSPNGVFCKLHLASFPTTTRSCLHYILKLLQTTLPLGPTRIWHPLLPISYKCWSSVPRCGTWSFQNTKSERH